MKLEITHGEWDGVLYYARLFTNRRNTIPILSYVLIEAEDGVVKITATDMESVFRATLPALIEAPGRCCVNAQWLAASINVGGGDKITLTVQGDRATIQHGTFASVGMTLPVEDFPAEKVPGGKPLDLRWKADAMLRDLRAVRHCISSEEVRYYLNGVCLQREDDGALLLVATDGHRLGKALVTGATILSSQEAGQIVPREFLDRLMKILPGFGSDDLHVRLYPTSIEIFAAGGITLHSKLIDGTFPDWRRVVPPVGDDDVVVRFDDTKGLLKLLRRLGRLGGERSRPLNVRADDALSFTLRIMEPHTEAGIEVDGALAKVERPDNRNVGVQLRYLVDIVDAAGGRPVIWSRRRGSVDAPMRLQVEGDEARPGALYVLMPMRV